MITGVNNTYILYILYKKYLFDGNLIELFESTMELG